VRCNADAGSLVDNRDLPAVRASQKDSYYISTLKEQLENAFRGLLGVCRTAIEPACLTAASGPRWLQKYAQEVDFSSKLLYFSLTTFLGGLPRAGIPQPQYLKPGSQTLGEEYTDILQISRHRVPSKLVGSFSWAPTG
jgi:hypothetical protein